MRLVWIVCDSCLFVLFDVGLDFCELGVASSDFGLGVYDVRVDACDVGVYFCDLGVGSFYFGVGSGGFAVGFGDVGLDYCDFGVDVGDLVWNRVSLGLDGFWFRLC